LAASSDRADVGCDGRGDAMSEFADTYNVALEKLRQQIASDEAVKRFLNGAKKMPDGTKPVVICAGNVEEAKDMDDAQRKAEAAAHQKSADAYILKPVRRISPKREVVSTELS